jgi:hypothetical protein
MPATTDRPDARPLARALAPTSTPDPGLPDWVRRPTAGFWGALSFLRRRQRIFHPAGVAYEATFTTLGGAATGAPLFDVPGEHRAIVRASRGAGLPEPLPDALGLAIRICDAHGPDRDQDFLLITSADGPLLHHLLLPAPGGFFGQTYSSILTYRIGERLWLVGALPGAEPGGGAPRGTLGEIDEAARHGRAVFKLAVATVGGRWKPVGRLELGDRVSDVVAEDLRFNPWHTGGGIRPDGPFQGIRDAAYRGSQVGRGAR